MRHPMTKGGRTGGSRDMAPWWARVGGFCATGILFGLLGWQLSSGVNTAETQAPRLAPQAGFWPLLLGLVLPLSLVVGAAIVFWEGQR